MPAINLPLDPHETSVCDESLPAKAWWVVWTIYRQHQINRAGHCPFWASLRASTRWAWNALSWTKPMKGYD